MSIAYIGVDPGITGAVALIHDGEAVVWDTPSHTIKVSQKDRLDYDFVQMASVMKAVKAYCVEFNLLPTVVLEQVGTMPSDGRVGAFNFGKGWGAWQGILCALDLPYCLVSPLRWKRHFGLLTADKRECLPIAKQLYPNTEPLLKRIKDHNRGDAILLAHWGRETAK